MVVMSVVTERHLQTLFLISVTIVVLGNTRQVARVAPNVQMEKNREILEMVVISVATEQHLQTLFLISVTIVVLGDTR
jgi:hypothetical protein